MEGQPVLRRVQCGEGEVGGPAGRLVEGGRGWEGWTGVAAPGLGVSLGATGSGEKWVRQLVWSESTGLTS